MTRITKDTDNNCLPKKKKFSQLQFSNHLRHGVSDGTKAVTVFWVLQKNIFKIENWKNYKNYSLKLKLMISKNKQKY